ncbi:MAG TPA: hypothetical protein VKE22_12900 [Haliangiales bacterium]|nr:hypothetical protein [Haliangiales bacterium]
MRLAPSLLLAALALGCAKRAAAPAIAVPATTTEIHCDGELTEPPWRSPARTGAFVDARGNAVAPYSEARFLRDAERLYVGLYAADQDIQSATDAFVLTFASDRGRATFSLSPRGEVTPPVAGLLVGADADGTIDDSTDEDEEWVVEAGFPLKALPIANDGTVEVEVSRCDTPHDGVRRCGAWKGRLSLPPAR